jgi:Leucine-rich repeat (LRR) protein
LDRPINSIGKVFTNLSYLGLGHNLKYIDTETFAGMENLTVLNLSRNPLENLIENVFEKLGELEKLILSECKLKKLPTKIFFHQQKLESIIKA